MINVYLYFFQSALVIIFYLLTRKGKRSGFLLLIPFFSALVFARVASDFSPSDLYDYFGVFDLSRYVNFVIPYREGGVDLLSKQIFKNNEPLSEIYYYLISFSKYDLLVGVFVASWSGYLLGKLLISCRDIKLHYSMTTCRVSLTVFYAFLIYNALNPISDIIVTIRFQLSMLLFVFVFYYNVQTKKTSILIVLGFLSSILVHNGAVILVLLWFFTKVLSGLSRSVFLVSVVFSSISLRIIYLFFEIQGSGGGYEDQGISSYVYLSLAFLIHLLIIIYAYDCMKSGRHNVIRYLSMFIITVSAFKMVLVDTIIGVRLDVVVAYLVFWLITLRGVSFSFFQFYTHFIIALLSIALLTYHLLVFNIRLHIAG